MSYLTQTDYNRFSTLPISLPETELRTRCYIQVCAFNLTEGLVMEMACCHLHVLRVLTPGVTPVLADSSLGLASVGLLASSMLSGAVGLVTQNAVGTAAWNADQPVVITAPGIYRVVVINNSVNVDLAVLVTGSVRVRDVGAPVQAGQLFIPTLSTLVSSTGGGSSSVTVPAVTVPVVPVNVAATITTQPTNQSVKGSTLVTWPGYGYTPVPFTVEAAGDAPLTYQWQVQSIDDDINWHSLSGETNTTYTARVGKMGGLPTIALPHVFRYASRCSFRCIVTNPFGAVTSNEVKVIVT